MKKITKATIIGLGTLACGAVAACIVDSRIRDSIDVTLEHMRMYANDCVGVLSGRKCPYTSECSDESCRIRDIQGCENESDIMNRIKQLKDITKCNFKCAKESIKLIMEDTDEDEDDIEISISKDPFDELMDKSTSENTDEGKNNDNGIKSELEATIEKLSTDIVSKIKAIKHDFDNLATITFTAKIDPVNGIDIDVNVDHKDDKPDNEYDDEDDVDNDLGDISSEEEMAVEESDKYEDYNIKDESNSDIFSVGEDTDKSTDTDTDK